MWEDVAGTGARVRHRVSSVGRFACALWNAGKGVSGGLPMKPRGGGRARPWDATPPAAPPPPPLQALSDIGRGVMARGVILSYVDTQRVQNFDEEFNEF